MAVMSFSRLAAGGRRSTNTHLPRGQTSLAMKGRRGDVVSMGGRPGDAATNEGAVAQRPPWAVRRSPLGGGVDGLNRGLGGTASSD